MKWALQARVELVIALTAVLGALQCTSSADQADGAAPTACVTGRSLPCAGQGSCSGYQVCNPDGKSYGACQCGALPDATTGDGGGVASEAGPGADAMGRDSTASDAGADMAVGDSGSGSGGDDGMGGNDATLRDATTDARAQKDASPNPLDGSLFCTSLICAPGMALASVECVSPDDPAFGCGAGPGPCGLPHARQGCRAGACVLVSCDPGWADCDANPLNGCEADLTSTATCNACNVACAAGEQCLSTGCVSTCAAPNINCAGTCRNLASDLHACGSCNKNCSPGETCANGSCACGPGYRSCNGTCVDSNSNASACGSNCQNCSVPPSSPLGSNGSGECVAGVCTALCMRGYTACSVWCVNTATDPANCGQCGAMCASGESCVAGSCQPLAAIQWISGVTPTHIAQDASNIYWTDPGDDTINVAPKISGRRMVLATSKSSALAIDEAYVYWVDPSSLIAYRVPQGGGTVSPIATLSVSGPIVVDSTYLYTLGYSRVLKTGGTPATFATLEGSQGDLASDGMNLYATATIGTSRMTKGVFIIGKDGTITPLVSTAGMGTFSTLSADRFGPYWLFNFGSLHNIKGGPPVGTGRALPQAVTVPLTMASDGCSGVYWTTGGPDIWFDNGVYPAQTVAGGKATTELVLDNDYLYWTDTGGWVGRLAKY